MSVPGLIVIHLTDLHFGEESSKSFTAPNFTYTSIATLIAEAIKRDFPKSESIIAIGGDITNRGKSKKYQYAIDFLEVLKRELTDGGVTRYILCPGNHDIETENENLFEGFNIFSSELTRSEKFIFTKTVTSVLYETNNWSFIATNSIYHGDHSYGLIDVESLEKLMATAKYPIFLLTHHHLIPTLRNDLSTTRNSYDIIRLCLKYKARIVVHGHIHSSFKLEFGDARNKIWIVGCGATLPKLATNYNNQFNVIELFENGEFRPSRYRITFDNIETYKPQAEKLTF
jgi:3',5'-cyclic AMP phosphodiesterase CpdA